MSPAVAPESSDVARIIRRVGCGAVADPDDPAAVVAAVRKLRANPEELAAMGQRARAAAQEFERQKHLALFVGVVESVGSA